MGESFVGVRFLGEVVTGDPLGVVTVTEEEFTVLTFEGEPILLVGVVGLLMTGTGLTGVAGFPPGALLVGEPIFKTAVACFLRGPPSGESLGTAVPGLATGGEPGLTGTRVIFPGRFKAVPLGVTFLP